MNALPLNLCRLNEKSNSDAYAEFLASKEVVIPTSGFDPTEPLGSHLFPFQRDIVRWALRRGKAAIFADCGMGKTVMQLEWARHIGGPVLILAPLAVTKQTAEEGKKFGIAVQEARSQEEAGSGITITNYEMLDHFDTSKFRGIVLDESSILKAHDGKTRTRIIQAFSKTPFRLACTATPAPNDYMELGNHSEFLGIMTMPEMLAMYFVHDSSDTQKWRLKGHAEGDFWKWLASWAVTVRRPSDLGYEDGEFILPPLSMHEHIAATMPGAKPAKTLQERIQARRESVPQRVARCADLVNSTPGPWIVWCNLNAESSAAVKAIPGAVEVRGSDKSEVKAARMMAFTRGEIRVLVTKPSICGFGMNWQHCANVAFLGLSDSYEQFYQAIRRCWRFGQHNPVGCHVVIADTEGAVLGNIRRKEDDARNMADNLVDCMGDLTRQELQRAAREETEYRKDVQTGSDWTMHLSDCVELTRGMPSDSVHYSIFSPPFASLYTYSSSLRDMGNSRTYDEFREHFGYLVKELYRITMPGRLLSFRCMNLPTSKVRHGYIGIVDFRGHLIRMFQEAGFIYHSEVCIWKNPVTAMQRTKALGLLHKQLKKDSTMSRQGIADYLVTMRKPGENPERVSHTNESFPVNLWQQYASPVWMDINQSNVLNGRLAREHKDEKHLCPLQLEVIDRAIELWTNPRNVVFSPFAGIASEGYVALRRGRRFIGCELKESYWRMACANLKQAHDAPGEAA